MYNIYIYILCCTNDSKLCQQKLHIVCRGFLTSLFYEDPHYIAYSFF